MRLSFITDEATQEPMGFVELARRFSVESVELRTVWGEHVAALDYRRLGELRRLLEDAGIGVCCVDSPVFKCDIDSDLGDEAEKFRRCADVASRLNTDAVRVFTFWRRARRERYEERVLEALGSLEEPAKSAGVRVVVENGRRTMHCTGAELRSLLENLDGATFSALWDPGNCIYGGTDFRPTSNGYPEIARFVSHVHIKDPRVYVGGRREYVELGKGQLDVERQIAALREDDYGGFVSLETHWRPDRTFSPDELDLPGGRAFSGSGYEATMTSLQTLRDLIPAG